MGETILKLDNVTKVYPNGTVANRDINMEFNARYVSGGEGPSRGSCVMN